MGLRTLIFLLLLGLVVWLIRRWLLNKGAGQARQQKPGGRMLRCAHCGLHVPEDEALISDGQSYCCEQHRQLGPQD